MGLFDRSKKESTPEVAETASVAVQDISGDYVIDPSHSAISFTARHAMVTKVRGNFGVYEGTAHVDASNPAASSVTVTIQTASVTTGNEQRDGHLKTPDFFDIENYPEATFVSTSVERDGTDWDITGDLTINGVTKSVTIPFEETGSAKDPFGNTRVGFEGATTIDRTEWNLSFNAALETGGVLVSEKVKLE
ncbi:MAG: YceI family protein, partial [Terracoccus sp.]